MLLFTEQRDTCMLTIRITSFHGHNHRIHVVKKKHAKKHMNTLLSHDIPDNKHTRIDVDQT